MAPRTEPVVDARFCAPHATAFTVTITNGWTWRDFTVTDDAGDAVVMRVKAAKVSFRSRFSLVDAASRRTVVTMQRRAPSLFMPDDRRWEAFRGASTSPTDLLFEAVPRPALFSWGEVDVHLAGRDPSESLRRREFVVVCRGPECTVHRRSSGAAVAKIEDTSEQRLEYNVSVSPGVDHAFILALTVILDEIRLDETS
ncbi:hypothetical protein VPH35_093573 [Triticum aestivum]